MTTALGPALGPALGWALASALRAATAAGTVLAVAGTVHAAVNLRLLRKLPADPPPVLEPVTLLLPVRNEAARVEACLRSLLSQRGLRDLRIIVLDDESTDGTSAVVRAIAQDDASVTLVEGRPVPHRWWGKTWACQQLADVAVSSPGSSQRQPGVLVFVDADVVLSPDAVAATVTQLRWSGLDLVSPFPRQVAVTAAERLVQPLLQWSWLTTLPLRVAERSARRSLAAATGQLLAVDTAAYRRAGGHAAVRDDVLDDIGLLRAVKASGGRGTVVDGTPVASCRMYDGWPALRSGYAKSLWSAFGSPAGAAAVVTVLCVAYVLPPLAALRGRRVGVVGYGAAVAGRVLVGRRTGARTWPDALLHPVSVLAFGWLTVDSWRQRRTGSLVVRGRRLT
jgi:hypothetical protein